MTLSFVSCERVWRGRCSQNRTACWALLPSKNKLLWKANHRLRLMTNWFCSLLDTPYYYTIRAASIVLKPVEKLDLHIHSIINMDLVQVLAYPSELISVFHNSSFKLKLGTGPRPFDRRSKLLVQVNKKYIELRRYPSTSLGKLLIQGSTSNPLVVEGTIFLHLVGGKKEDLRTINGRQKLLEALDNTIHAMRNR